MSDQSTDSAQQTDAGATGGTPAGTGTQPVQQAEAPKPGFTQDQLNAAIAEEKRRWKKQQDDEAKELQRKADEAAAVQRGEFEKIANERGARATELEGQLEGTQAQLTALTEAMEKQIKARIKPLPDELREMIPESADVLTRYELVGKAELAAAKLSAIPPAPKPPLGTPPGPRGSGTSNTTHTPDLVAQKRAGGEYAV